MSLPNQAERRKRLSDNDNDDIGNNAAKVGERYTVYELLTLFTAYTGLRAEELAGLEVGDLDFAPGPKCVVNVRRAEKRRNGEWLVDTLKSARSSRTVPLPPWPAERMVDYLADDHPPRSRAERAALAQSRTRRVLDTRASSPSRL